MFNVKFKEKAREARKTRVRNKIHGTNARPRLAVFKSAKQIYVQLIDDDKGVTLASASTLADEIKGKGKERAATLGKLIAERAVAKGHEAIVFDRASYRYHGQIKELADAARTAGLKF
jgi:large subunit ribosomal protein L18